MNAHRGAVAERRGVEGISSVNVHGSRVTPDQQCWCDFKECLIFKCGCECLQIRHVFCQDTLKERRDDNDNSRANNGLIAKCEDTGETSGFPEIKAVRQSSWQRKSNQSRTLKSSRSVHAMHDGSLVHKSKAQAPV